MVTTTGVMVNKQEAELKCKMLVNIFIDGGNKTPELHDQILIVHQNTIAFNSQQLVSVNMEHLIVTNLTNTCNFGKIPCPNTIKQLNILPTHCVDSYTHTAVTNLQALLINMVVVPTSCQSDVGCCM